MLRHAHAGRADVCLETLDGVVRLSVVDDCVGLGGSTAGGGMRGMRERALLIGAKLEVESWTGAGVAVTLDVPAEHG